VNKKKFKNKKRKAGHIAPVSPTSPFIRGRIGSLTASALALCILATKIVVAFFKKVTTCLLLGFSAAFLYFVFLACLDGFHAGKHRLTSW